MVKAVRLSRAEKRKEKQQCKSTPKKPILRRLKADLSALCATLEIPEQQSCFDAWLHLNSLGNKICLNLPIKFHKHYFELAELGTRCTQFIVTDKYIQIPFEITVQEKLPPTGCVGVDTGINALASTSVGVQYGTEIKNKIERVKRCQHGSKGQQRARRSLRQYIDNTVNEIMLIENLTLGLAKK